MIKRFFSRLIHISLWPFRWLLSPFVRLFKRLKSFFSSEPEEASLADSLQKAVENPYEILDHLNALRKHLFRAFGGLILATFLAFTFITPILEWLSKPVGGITKLEAIDVTEPIGVVMRVALLVGFSIALPYIAFEILLFLAPGLKPKARLVGMLGIPLVFVFFVAGMAFTFFFILPAALPVLLNFMGIPTMPRPSSYIGFVTSLMFWIGLAFEMPLLSYLLTSMGLLKGRMLATNWRIAVFVIAILAAAITPTVDPINMLIVMLPLLFLYGLSILLSYVARPRQLSAPQT